MVNPCFPVLPAAKAAVARHGVRHVSHVRHLHHHAGALPHVQHAAPAASHAAGCPGGVTPDGLARVLPAGPGAPPAAAAPLSPHAAVPGPGPFGTTVPQPLSTGGTVGAGGSPASVLLPKAAAAALGIGAAAAGSGGLVYLFVPGSPSSHTGVTDVSPSAGDTSGGLMSGVSGPGGTFGGVGTSDLLIPDTAGHHPVSSGSPFTGGLDSPPGTAVPEPASVLLFGFAVVCAVIVSRRAARRVALR